MEQIKVAIEKANAARRAKGAPAQRPVLRDSAARDQSDGAVSEDIVKDASAEATTPEHAAPGRAPIETPQVEPSSPDDAPEDVDANWLRLERGELNLRVLKRNRIVSYKKSHRSYASFDVMRTRLRQTMKSRGWRTIGITSPTPGCGKTVVSANLAFSVARQQGTRTLLMDMDFKAPKLASYLGVNSQRSLRGYLEEQTTFDEYLMSFEDQLAIGFNGERVPDAAELIGRAATKRVLANTIAKLNPNVAIFDLAPLLPTDDALAVLPHLDCVALVIGAGQTKPEEILECERLLEGQTNYLGVILNKSEARSADGYGYY